MACEWASKNGVTFDHGKSEALLFSRERMGPTAAVTAGSKEIPFNKEATRWLGIWLDVYLNLQDYQTVMMKKGRATVINYQSPNRKKKGLPSSNLRMMVLMLSQFHNQ